MYRILLVDDEILVRDAIKENIDWEGIGCQLVGDCEMVGRQQNCKGASSRYCADRYSDALYGWNGAEPFSP